MGFATYWHNIFGGYDIPKPMVCESPVHSGSALNKVPRHYFLIDKISSVLACSHFSLALVST
uniref:Uncharacterized protein n=1 Tax=Rhizophora mucronata TaxID=61149 RepID=A0A2P2PW52_RHIMU